MINRDTLYDIAVIGGGLAGLSLAIQSARAGYKTIVFEKEQYPFHRVCGEYISLESESFLTELGLPLEEMNLPRIQRLEVTAPGGNKISATLPLGGLGISRYTIDYELSKLATGSGACVAEETKVEDVHPQDDYFVVQYVTHRNQRDEIRCKVVTGCFGKRSNLDIKWKRRFSLRKKNRLNNYVGVKYHIHTDWPDDLIALHNFENGYCGISKVEDGKYCLCYLTTAANLQLAGHSIPAMEKKFLHKNPHLEKIFNNAIKTDELPVTIAQISFDKKQPVENHILMVGDAAGMITPLCGNGMSMALHASKLAFEQTRRFLKNEITRTEMEEAYTRDWNRLFSKRLRTGRLIQSLFGKPWMTNLLIRCLKPFPRLVRFLIQQTHGQSF